MHAPEISWIAAVDVIFVVGCDGIYRDAEIEGINSDVFGQSSRSADPFREHYHNARHFILRRHGLVQYAHRRFHRPAAVFVAEKGAALVILRERAITHSVSLWWQSDRNIVASCGNEANIKQLAKVASHHASVRRGASQPVELLPRRGVNAHPDVGILLFEKLPTHPFIPARNKPEDIGGIPEIWDRRVDVEQ